MAILRNAALAVLLLALSTLAQAGDDRQLLTVNPARANVLIVLDTSGSMVGTTDVDLVADPASIDAPESKIAIAKRALRDLLNHEDTVNFGFAHFKQNFSGSPLTINGQTAVNSTNVVKQWLYIAGAQSSGAANPWSASGDRRRAGRRAASIRSLCFRSAATAAIATILCSVRGSLPRRSPPARPPRAWPRGSERTRATGGSCTTTPTGASRASRAVASRCSSCPGPGRMAIRRCW